MELIKKITSNKPLLYGIGGVMLLTMSYLLYTHATEKPVAKKEIPVVRTVTVGEQKVEGIATYPGEIRGRYESTLAFQTAGKISQRYVKIGDRVKAGQVLLALDPKDISQGTAAAQAALAAAESSQKLAAENAKRYEQLYKAGAVGQAVYDNYRTQLDAANAQLRQAQAQAQVNNNQLEYTQLRSDVDGIVAALNGEIGMVVGAGTPMATIVKANEYEVQINVPEKAVRQLKVGQNAKISLWAVEELQLEGSISEIAQMADILTKTFRVRVALNNIPPQVKLGMTAKVTLSNISNAAQPTAQYLLPASALYQVNGKQQVWVVQDNKVKLVPVTVANYQENQLLIKAGLKPGDIVVTAGVSKLTEQQQVRLQTKKSGEQK